MNKVLIGPSDVTKQALLHICFVKSEVASVNVRSLDGNAREGCVQFPCPLWVKSRHVQCTNPCPLSANSGHSSPSFNHLVTEREQRRGHARDARPHSKFLYNRGMNENFFNELSAWMTQAGLAGTPETDIVSGSATVVSRLGFRLVASMCSSTRSIRCTKAACSVGAIAPTESPCARIWSH